MKFVSVSLSQTSFLISQKLSGQTPLMYASYCLDLYESGTLLLLIS